MGTRMTHTARAELTHVVRRRYGAATGAEKRKILDESLPSRVITRSRRFGRSTPSRPSRDDRPEAGLRCMTKQYALP